MNSFPPRHPLLLSSSFFHKWRGLPGDPCPAPVSVNVTGLQGALLLEVLPAGCPPHRPAPVPTRPPRPPGTPVSLCLCPWAGPGRRVLSWTQASAQCRSPGSLEPLVVGPPPRPGSCPVGVACVGVTRTLSQSCPPGPGACRSAFRSNSAEARAACWGRPLTFPGSLHCSSPRSPVSPHLCARGP